MRQYAESVPLVKPDCSGVRLAHFQSHTITVTRMSITLADRQQGRRNALAAVRRAHREGIKARHACTGPVEINRRADDFAFRNSHIGERLAPQQPPPCAPRKPVLRRKPLLQHHKGGNVGFGGRPDRGDGHVLTMSSRWTMAGRPR